VCVCVCVCSCDTKQMCHMQSDTDRLVISFVFVRSYVQSFIVELFIVDI